MKVHDIFNIRPSAVAAVLVAGASVLVSLPASATLISRSFDGNDCRGFFGDSFDACEIFIGEGDNRFELSPVIAKLGYDDDQNLEETEINDGLYPSIDGSEFSVTFDDSMEGSFTYDPTGDDPGLKYWSVKYGSDFNLFWDVDDALLADGAACTDDPYNLTCLQGANVVTGGDWFTNEQNGLSHIVFYNSEPVERVPAPGILALLGIGLLGLFGASRRRMG